MKMMIELKYAILITLLTLLWLSLEFMVGLHDRFIFLHPYITLLAFLIPVFAYRQAIKEKREQLHSPITFKQILISGAIITVFSAILAIPEQLMFHTFINPDFFDNMRDYAAHKAMLGNQNINQAKADAALYFNLQSYIIQSVLVTLLIGSLLTVILAFRMRTQTAKK